ncbi:MAG: hypothetical protein VCE75_10450 [Alphaproteobacteria bacterium]
MQTTDDAPEIRLVLRQGPNGDLGVQIYDRTNRDSPLTLYAAGLIAELKLSPNRILARGEAAFEMWQNSPKEG